MRRSPSSFSLRIFGAVSAQMCDLRLSRRGGGTRDRDHLAGRHREIEVYSPLDLVGHALVTEHLPMLFKYLDVDRGFTVEVAIYSLDNSVESVWYPHTLRDREGVLTWLETVSRAPTRCLAARRYHSGSMSNFPGRAALRGCASGCGRFIATVAIAKSSSRPVLARPTRGSSSRLERWRIRRGRAGGRS